MPKDGDITKVFNHRGHKEEIFRMRCVLCEKTLCTLWLITIHAK